MAYKQSNNPLSRKTSPLRDKGNHPHPHKKPGVISIDSPETASTSVHPKGQPNPNPLIGQPMPDVPYEKISDMEEIGAEQPDYEDPDWKPGMSRKSSPLNAETTVEDGDRGFNEAQQKRTSEKKDPPKKDPKREEPKQKVAASYVKGEKVVAVKGKEEEGASEVKIIKRVGGKPKKVDNSRKAIKKRKSEDKEAGKSKAETRTNKTKSKAQGARDAANKSKDADRQKQLRAKGDRLDKRAKRQEGRAGRKANRQATKTKNQESRAKQKNK